MIPISTLRSTHPEAKVVFSNPFSTSPTARDPRGTRGRGRRPSGRRLGAGARGGGGVGEDGAHRQLAPGGRESPGGGGGYSLR